MDYQRTLGVRLPELGVLALRLRVGCPRRAVGLRVRFFGKRL